MILYLGGVRSRSPRPSHSGHQESLTAPEVLHKLPTQASVSSQFQVRNKLIKGSYNGEIDEMRMSTFTVYLFWNGGKLSGSTPDAFYGHKSMQPTPLT